MASRFNHRAGAPRPPSQLTNHSPSGFINAGNLSQIHKAPPTPVSASPVATTGTSSVFGTNAAGPKPVVNPNLPPSPSPTGAGGAAQVAGTAPSSAQDAYSLGFIADANPANFSLGGDNGASLINAYGRGATGKAPILQSGQNSQQSAMGLASDLAHGIGPSVARAQMDRALSQGFANLSSQSAGMGTANQGGLGARNLLQAEAALQAQAAGQGAIAGASEQVGNIKNYGDLATTARGQNIDQYFRGVNGQAATENTQLNSNQAYDLANRTAGTQRATLTNDQHDFTANAGANILNVGLQAIKDAGKGVSAALPSARGGGGGGGGSSGGGGSGNSGNGVTNNDGSNGQDTTGNSDNSSGGTTDIPNADAPPEEETTTA